MKDFYRRHLPHYQPPDCAFSITFRLAGALPRSVIQALREEKELSQQLLAGLHDNKERWARLRECREEYENKFEEALDTDYGGPRSLERQEIASLVVESRAYSNGRTHDLLAHSVMPNHVHTVIGMGDWLLGLGMEEWRHNAPPHYTHGAKSLTDVLAAIKKHSALQANRILKQAGPFWQDESYDRLIRNGEKLLHAIRYTIMNPVKAGLCETWEEWPWTYCAPWLRDLV